MGEGVGAEEVWLRKMESRGEATETQAGTMGFASPMRSQPLSTCLTYASPAHLHLIGYLPYFLPTSSIAR